MKPVFGQSLTHYKTGLGNGAVRRQVVVALLMGGGGVETNLTYTEQEVCLWQTQ